MAVRIRLLGAVEAHIDDQPVDLGHARQRAVFVAMLVDMPRPVQIDELIARIWGAAAPRRARETLYSYLSRLRQAFAGTPDVRIARHSAGYLLAADPGVVDLHKFELLLRQARDARNDDTALERFDAALGLWRGIPLAGLDSPWLDRLRRRLEDQRLGAELDRADVALRCGHHAELLTELSERADAYPLDERITGQLMLALYRCGRAADALLRYERARSQLAEELGTDPGPALQRLHRQILAADSRLTAPEQVRPTGSPGPGSDVPASPRPPVHEVPAAPVTFTARDTELAQLVNLLCTKRLIALDGVPGVGKSAIAMRLAHLVAERFPDGQIFADLQGSAAGLDPVKPYELLVRWLRLFGVSGGAVPADLSGAAAAWRDTIAGKRILVVLDNAMSVDQVRPLMPADPACATIITSRSVLSTLDGAAFVRIEPLDSTAGVELLSTLAGRQRIQTDLPAARRIVGLCERLPLLIRIIAARMAARPDWPVRAFADRLADERRRLDELQIGEFSVRAGLSVGLRDVGPAATRMFALLATLRVPAIDLPLAASLAGTTLNDAEATLDRLVDARMVDCPQPDRYLMHDVVRLYARERSAAEISAGERHAARRGALAHYLALAGQASALLDPHDLPPLGGPPIDHPAGHRLDDRQAAIEWIDANAAELTTVAAELAAVPELASDAARLALAAYSALMIRDRAPEIVRLNTVAVHIARDLGDAFLAGRAHNILGIGHGILGSHDAATREFQSALRYAEQSGDRRTIGGVLNNFGILARQRNELAAAIDYHERCLELFRDGGDRRGQGQAMGNLGLVYQVAGDHERAASTYQNAAEIFREVGDQHLLGMTLGRIANILRLTGRHQTAVDVFAEALRELRQCGGRLGEADHLWWLGQTLYELNDVQGARVHWRESLKLLQDSGHITEEQARATLAEPTPTPPTAIAGG
ncbi:BTAD domain-containing putative transcriptional regulator [Micromonospora sp. URMC 103]|uniref:AfsR/SARP family transcriptional regulator n=1 Tax=Micromonospora sp. URMC 103 TaxID=3423406 RepID=UPI003F1A348B